MAAQVKITLIAVGQISGFRDFASMEVAPYREEWHLILQTGHPATMLCAFR